MTVAVSIRLARRELRGGVKKFRVFLICLTLGVAAIAAVGSVRTSIEQGLKEQGRVILGGDAQMEFTYRFASKDEKSWMASHAATASETVEFRSMVVAGTGAAARRGLTEIKAIDSAYPIYGHLSLTPDMTVDHALSVVNDIPGAVMEQVLSGRMGLKIGDVFRLGTQSFRLNALIEKEPDAAAQGIGLAPRTIVRTKDLSQSGLLGPGTLFETKYRLKIPPDVKIWRLKRAANQLFRDTGMRWRDRRNASPGVQVFVDRIGSFLVLVGLAGLAVGGIGVSSAVRTYLDSKTAVIATLKTLGADAGTIFGIYFTQIAILSTLALVAGVALGAALPLAIAPVLSATLPLPLAVTVHAAPLIEAGLYGILTALLFTLWPIARTELVRPADLFRDGISQHRALPRARYIVMTAVLLAALVGLATWYASVPKLALWTFGGIAAALVVLVLAAVAVRRFAAVLARSNLLRGHTGLRIAFGAIGGPASEAMPVILSLGLGLSVLGAIGQIDSNLRANISGNLPAVAPSFFFIDIQQDQLQGFLDMTKNNPQVSRVETAPMMRGIITRINGRPAREVAGNHWVVTGDRGITFSEDLPARTHLTAGTWWPKGYTGPPLVSFAAREAKEIGLKLGDHLTINILGRDIKTRIASFRDVDFSTAGMGFVLSLNPAAVAGAPHTSIATVYASRAAESGILRAVGEGYPNITAIGVRTVIERVAGVLNSLAAATSYGALVTLVTGFVVLIGAAAAGERAREYEAAILKTIGATRGKILLSFALRAAILGAAAGLVAIFAGAIAGWAVMRFVMETPYVFDVASALGIVFGGAMVTLLAGLMFAFRPLSVRPSRILRARE